MLCISPLCVRSPDPMTCRQSQFPNQWRSQVELVNHTLHDGEPTEVGKHPASNMLRKILNHEGYQRSLSCDFPTAPRCKKQAFQLVIFS